MGYLYVFIVACYLRIDMDCMQVLFACVLMEDCYGNMDIVLIGKMDFICRKKQQWINQPQLQNNGYLGLIRSHKGI